jgi:hypothetical protein
MLINPSIHVSSRLCEPMRERGGGKYSRRVSVGVKSRDKRQDTLFLRGGGQLRSNGL